MPHPVVHCVRISCLAAALLLAACASDEPAPIEDHSIPALADEGVSTPQAGANTYRVQKGDTLYAIAFTRGLDYRDLAAWNHIEPPYRIFIGQELILKPSTAATAESPGGAAVTTAAPDTAMAASVSALPAAPQGPAIESPAPMPPRQSAAAPPAPVKSSAAAVPKTPDVAEPAAVARTAKPATASPAEPAAKTAEAPPQLNAGGVSWRWPAEGNVIGTYVAGDQTRQGIDIAGKEGDGVVATADGEVVYSGNGLLGYGELIIIKHNTTFLSAYGHNRMRLVKEGERVKGGQRIAEMGASAAARDELHFEIRKSGKPVNPLDYLPVR
jgi:lipoprotein NlpD